MGGYLAIAVGVTFLVIRPALPRQLLWAMVLAALGVVLVYPFRRFHVSQVVLPLAIPCRWIKAAATAPRIGAAQ